MREEKKHGGVNIGGSSFILGIRSNSYRYPFVSNEGEKKGWLLARSPIGKTPSRTCSPSLSSTPVSLSRSFFFFHVVGLSNILSVRATPTQTHILAFLISRHFWVGKRITTEVVAEARPETQDVRIYIADQREVFCLRLEEGYVCVPV